MSRSLSRPSTQPLLWFCVVILLLFMVFAAGDRTSPNPSPWVPQPRHSVLGNVAAFVVDLFTGGRPFRGELEASDYAIRAVQLENLDSPAAESSDGNPLIAHNRGW